MPEQHVLRPAEAANATPNLDQAKPPPEGHTSHMINKAIYDELQNSVRLVDDTLYIEHYETSDPDVIRVVKNQPAPELPGYVETLLRIGAAAIARAQLVQDYDFVRAWAEKSIVTAGAHAKDIIQQTAAELDKQLNGENGAMLDPVRKQLEQVNKVVEERTAELRKQLDPHNPNSDLHGAITGLRRLMDASYADSVPVRLGQAIEAIAAKDGTLARSVKAVVKEALDLQIEPLRKQVETLEKGLLQEKAAAEAAADIIQSTTHKGAPFEEDVLRRVKSWASICGGETHHVGTDNKPGDVLSVFGASGALGMDLRLVLEAKDDAVARGRKRLQDDLTKALDHREGDAAIFVGKTHTAFGAEIGEWDEGVSDNRPWIACTVDHLHVALRYLVVLKRLRDRACKASAIDAGAIEEQVQVMRTALRRITTIKTAASSITKSVGQVTSEGDQLGREVEASLRIIEGMLEE